MFLHKCPPNLGVWDGLWRFDFNCKLHSKHFCVVSEKRMRNESHKKNIGQQKSGEGVRKKGRTLLPHPLPLLHFLALVPFFAPLKPKNSIPLSLVFLHSEVYHMEILATHSGYYNCYELTHCFRLRVFVNNGLPR